MNDPSSIGLDLAVVAALILAGSVFVAAELALVSLRDSQVQALGQRGRRGQAVVRLTEDPNRLLASVQMGVTLSAALSSAFGALTLTASASALLTSTGLSATWASPLAFLIVTVGITVATLVLGELVPKRIALQRNEACALLLAPTIERIARISGPAIWLLSALTNTMVRLLGADPQLNREQISEEELRGMVAATESLDDTERDLIDDVFGAGERSVREVMVPRTEVVFLDSNVTALDALRTALELPHSRYPVSGRGADHVVGFIHLRDLLTAVHGRGAGRSQLRQIMRPAPSVPSSKRVLECLTEMRTSGAHLAVVVDEYGGTAGIVTLEDLLEEVIGEIRDEFDGHESDPVEHEPGVLDVDALMHLDEFADHTGVRLPDGAYESVGGYVLSALGRLAELGDICECPGATLEVVELDGRRVATVRVRLLDSSDASTDASTGGEQDADASRDAGHDAGHDASLAGEVPARS